MSRQTLAELWEMFALGRDMPAARWTARIKGDAAFARPAARLVWQADGRRFMAGDGCAPEGPVSLAHPVELDADEILRWRALLAERKIRQPFRQMWEPVVLVNGRLPGRVTAVQSAGERYRMLDRYRGYRLPLSAMPALRKEGFRFIERRRWERGARRQAEIQVVNIVTPAGIFYECSPDRPITRLSAGSDARLDLGMFYPFGGVRLRALNHTAAAVEAYLIQDFVWRGALDMLLPHLPGMPAEELRALRARVGRASPREGGDPEGVAALLDRLIAREEAALC